MRRLNPDVRLGLQNKICSTRTRTVRIRTTRILLRLEQIFYLILSQNKNGRNAVIDLALQAHNGKNNQATSAARRKLRYLREREMTDGTETTIQDILDSLGLEI